MPSGGAGVAGCSKCAGVMLTVRVHACRDSGGWVDGMQRKVPRPRQGFCVMRLFGGRGEGRQRLEVDALRGR
jgi:hypothetical protein